MEARVIVSDKPFSASYDKMAEIVEHLGSPKALAMTHSELETHLQREGRELIRRMYQDHLDIRGPGERIGQVEDAAGNVLTHRRMQERRLTTVFGAVDVRRIGYGDRGKQSLHPLDADLNLPKEAYSLGVRRKAAEEAAKGSFDEATATIASTTGANVPKRQVEEVVARAAEDVDSFYADRQERATQASAPSGPILVMTMDGKGVVMRKEDLRASTRKKAERREHKMKKRLSRGEKRNAKRMATVAAVYTIDPFVRKPEDVVQELAPVRAVAPKRPRPEYKRVFATLEKSPEEVVVEMAKEASARDPKREKQWVGLVDGNETQLRLLEEMAAREGVGLHVVLDLIHVIEYLWRASSNFCHEESPEAERWVSERILRILQGYATDVAAGIRRSATKRGLEDRKAADECAQYILNHKKYMRYDKYLAKGFPIATGVIEGACRYLVKDRMDLTGARWSLSGAEAVLRLRSVRASGDFDEYWRYHEQEEKRRNHEALYANANIPPARPISRAQGAPRNHLRLVG